MKHIMRKRTQTNRILNKLKDYTNLGILLFAVFVLVSLFRVYKNINKAKSRINKARQEVLMLEEVNEDLRIRVDEVLSQQYLEYQARDGLGLSKEGEVVLVLPDEEELKKLVPDVPDFEEDETEDMPNWRKWLDFFYF